MSREPTTFDHRFNNKMCDFSEYGGKSDEWLAVEASQPPPVMGHDLSLQALLELRKQVNKGREEIAARDMKALAEKVETHDHAIPARDGQALEARTYRPVSQGQQKLPVYIHLHGGGFLFGTLDSENAICAHIAVNCNVVVLNVNYRHTPEFTYPTAWNDTEDAFVWLHQNIEKLAGDRLQVVIGGISAGAQLAASLTLAKHLQTLDPAAQVCPAIAGQVLMIPALAHIDHYDKQMSRMKDPSVSSVKENVDAPILSSATIRLFVDLLAVEDTSADDLRFSPGNASVDQVKGLPPTTVAVTGLDPLRDEGLLYAKMLMEAG